MNVNLKKVSKIIPDITNKELKHWNQLISRIHTVWWGFKARLLVKKIKAKLSQNLLKSAAIDKIQHRYLRCQRLNKLRQLAYEIMHKIATVKRVQLIQSFLRGWLAVNHAAHLLYLHLMGKYRCRMQCFSKQCATIAIQSVYRSHRARKHTLKLCTSAVTIQRTWRLFTLFRRVKMYIYQRRLQHRYWAYISNKSTLCIQVFIRKYLTKLHCQMELRCRVNAIQALNQERITQERHYFQGTKLDRNYIMVLHRVCREYSNFSNNQLIFKSMIHSIYAAQKVHNFIQRIPAITHKYNLRQHWIRTRCVERNLQEQYQAATDIQKMMRGFLARKLIFNLQKLTRATSTRIIKKFGMKILNKRIYKKMMVQNSNNNKHYLIAQERLYAALVIQSFYRMIRDMQYAIDYKNFVYNIKIKACVVIQSAIRRYLVIKKNYLKANCCINNQIYTRELQASASLRIQRHWKGYKARKSYKTKYLENKIMEQCREKSALLIQSTYRAYLCRQRYIRARIALKEKIHQNLTNEHLYTYAKIIQRFIRKYVFNYKPN